MAAIAGGHRPVMRCPRVLLVRHGLAGRDCKSEPANREYRRDQARGPEQANSHGGQRLHDGAETRLDPQTLRRSQRGVNDMLC